jgi:hypothetical protein
LLCCALLPLAASADSFWTRVGYECQDDRLILTYDDDMNELGEARYANKSETQWSPWDMVTMTYDEARGRSYITKITPVQGTCRNGFEITLTPEPGNMDVQGMCGGWMGAHVKVEYSGKILYAGSFESSCELSDEKRTPTIRRVLLRPYAAPKLRTTGENSDLDVLISHACEPKQDKLSFTYKFGEFDRDEFDRYNAPVGNETGKNYPLRILWDFRSSRDGIKSSCHLSDGDYHFVLTPVPGNTNHLDKCGDWLGARLVVTKADKTVYETQFADDCHQPDQPIIHSVTIRPGKKPEIQQISRPLFYDNEKDDAPLNSGVSP